MPTRKYKACPKCGITISAENKYCDKCQEKRNIEKRQYYDKLNKERENSNKRGYNYKWQQERKDFIKQYPYCDCGEKATVVDHIIPHKGNQKLFWDKSNWQPMCKRCHDKKTARGQ